MLQRHTVFSLRSVGITAEPGLAVFNTLSGVRLCNVP